MGEQLTGDRPIKTKYVAVVLEDRPCAFAGQSTLKRDSGLSKFESFIRDEYRVHLETDNLPVAELFTYMGNVESDSEQVYELGYPVGNITAGGQVVLNNHVDFVLLYNNIPDSDSVHVVGFLAYPSSRQFNATQGAECKSIEGQPINMAVDDKDEVIIPWTYSIYWSNSTTLWEDRWDPYFPITDEPLHWISISYSIALCLFLAGLVALILIRVLRAHAGRYSQLDPHDQAEDSGWKVLHGDVFRPPHLPMMLAVIVGAGTQVLATVVLLLVLGTSGFLSPANGGGLVTAIVVTYVLTGVFGGYASAKTYMTMRGTRRRRNAALSALFFPGTAFTIFFIMNIVLWSTKSSAGPSAGLFIGILAMYIGLNTPMIFLGNYLAYKRPVADFPSMTNPIPRYVPRVNMWFLSPTFIAVGLGLATFSVIFNEAFFVLSAIWYGHVYYVYGFVATVFSLLVLVTVEISIILCYFQLSNEDYHWWWQALLVPAVTSLYFFVYTIYFLAFRLSFTRAASVLLYFGYSLFMAWALFLLTAAVSFYGCLSFVRKIYSTVHID
eukprot:TRINITY_DN8874_c0_g1_i2.p1 TRINITY_DN8874_c0_g1~~TRINITY_DN8874_c0_g1_i2.p1  ORF type:complete len:641 (-),score=120.06 TRINITY_DN8874_c0_g1_i2:15-1670(-)